MRLPLLIAALLCCALLVDAYQAPKAAPPGLSLTLCPEHDCILPYLVAINQSTGPVRCAFYDVSDERLIAALNESGASLYLDRNNHFLREGKEKAYTGKVQIAATHYLMHDKFCLMPPGTVVTGSFNPTADNDNDNHVLVIEDEEIFERYGAYLDALEAERKVGSFLLVRPGFVACFPPYDDCRGVLADALANASSEIDGMIFSFTDPWLATILLQRREEGVNVSLLLEKSQARGVSSVEPYLVENDLSIQEDTCPCFLHHKVFIIDKKTVVLGSRNPTVGGSCNDENMLVIGNEGLAEELLAEKARLSAG